MSDCYIYYRVALDHEPAARVALHTMLDEVAATAGIRGQAHCKTHEPLLWMEVYPDVGDAEAFVSLLTGLSARHGLDACLEDNQRRHVELFIPLDPTP